MSKMSALILKFNVPNIVMLQQIKLLEAVRLSFSCEELHFFNLDGC